MENRILNLERQLAAGDPSALDALNRAYARAGRPQIELPVTQLGPTRLQLALACMKVGALGLTFVGLAVPVMLVWVPLVIVCNIRGGECLLCRDELASQRRLLLCPRVNL